MPATASIPVTITCEPLMMRAAQQSESQPRPRSRRVNRTAPVGMSRRPGFRQLTFWIPETDKPLLERHAQRLGLSVADLVIEQLTPLMNTLRTGVVP